MHFQVCLILLFLNFWHLQPSGVHGAVIKSGPGKEPDPEPVPVVITKGGITITIEQERKNKNDNDKDKNSPGEKVSYFKVPVDLSPDGSELELRNKILNNWNFGLGLESHRKKNNPLRYILAETEDRLTFTCSTTGNLITRWTSNILSKKTIKYEESKRLDQSPTIPECANCPDNLNETKLGDQNKTSVVVMETSYGTSGAIGCEAVGNSSVSNQLYIYVPDGGELVRLQDMTLVVDTNSSLIVPCIGNYPNANVTLEVKDDLDGEFKPVDPSEFGKEYDPRVGFVVQGQGKAREFYKCKSHSEKVHKTIEIRDVDVQFVNSGQVSLSDDYKINISIGSLKNQSRQVGVSSIVCRSKAGNNIQELQMLRCNSPHECDWRRKCFDNNCADRNNDHLESIEFFKAPNSQDLKQPFQQGIVSCKTSKLTLRRKDEKTSSTTSSFFYAFEYYFTGLDKQSYLTSNAVPKSALIKIDGGDQHLLYTDAPRKFQCEISSFLFISNIRFAIGFKNRSRILVDRTGNESFVENKRGGIFKSSIFVNLTKDMNEIWCFAPWFNSTEWINTSKTFTATDVILPKIVKAEDDDGTRILYIGDDNQLLHCAAEGEPKPEICWKFTQNNESVTQCESNEGESLHQFPKINSSLDGLYVCLARNAYGNDTFEFQVQVQERETGLGSGAIGGISVAGIGFLALVIAMIFLAFKYNEAKDQIRDLTEEEINEFNLGNPDAVKSDGAFNVQNMAFDPVYVISEVDLIIAKNAILGSGEYGMVYRGFLNGDAVAVKSTKPNPDVTYFKALLGEIKIMAYIGRHENVVEFRGAVVERIRERIAYAVVELSPLGNLHSYLRKVSSEFLNLVTHNEISTKGMNYTNVNPTVTTFNLIHWCVQIARGMDHLVRKKVIHGDLAARNVLVFRNDVVKITDFGLSRQLYGYSNYVKKQKAPLPWRWMAEESLRFMEFSSQSDVWSFGITCWEIFSFGQIPYPGYDWTLDFVEKLSRGLRLAIPNNAPKFIYNEIMKCWLSNSIDRPSFADLADFLHEAMKSIVIPGKIMSDSQYDNEIIKSDTKVQNGLKKIDAEWAMSSDPGQYPLANGGSSKTDARYENRPRTDNLMAGQNNYNPRTKKTNSYDNEPSSPPATTATTTTSHVIQKPPRKGQTDEETGVVWMTMEDGRYVDPSECERTLQPIGATSKKNKYSTPSPLPPKSGRYRNQPEEPPRLRTKNTETEQSYNNLQPPQKQDQQQEGDEEELVFKIPKKKPRPLLRKKGEADSTKAPPPPPKKGEVKKEGKIPGYANAPEAEEIHLHPHGLTSYANEVLG